MIHLIDKLIITYLCVIYLIEICQLLFFILFFYVAQKKIYGCVRLAVGLLVFFLQEIKRKMEIKKLKKRGKENQAGA